ncbi:hypothetical protein HPB48_008139 [Haemaphysalis longicornis]|uniref:Peptidase M13 N-terminal domain-containing protein n=1 Tax=Haemaphysalis longicornis TaxID=44386 RepID=A0A9J6FSB8_HAELO|nr:hypothetical protein HPB48_008139 [Haemaphysalis longicornis]
MDPTDTAPPASSPRNQRTVKSPKHSSKSRRKRQASQPGRRGRSRVLRSPHGIDAESPMSFGSVQSTSPVTSGVASPNAIPTKRHPCQRRQPPATPRLHPRIRSRNALKAAVDSCTWTKVRVPRLVMPGVLSGGRPPCDREASVAKRRRRVLTQGARRLRATVNRSVNPCQSFTRFVCDGWRRDNPHSVWQDQFRLVLKRLDTALHGVQWPRTGQNEEQRAAAVYQSCDDVFKGKRDELPAVKAALAEAGIIWPQISRGADVLYTLLYCSLKLGWDPLLHVNVDAISEKNVTLVVSPGRSIFILRGLYYRPHRSPGIGEAYFDFLRNAFRQAGNTSNSDVVTYNATAHYHNIAMPRLGRVVKDVPEAGPFADILASATHIDIAEVHWTETLQKLNVSQSANPPLLLTNHPTYMRGIVRTWTDLGNDPFHVFVSWCTVQVAALYSNEKLIFNHYDFNQLAVDFYHASFCVTRAAYFSRDGTFSKFNRDVLKRGSEDAARRLALSVRSAYFRRLSSWDHFDKNITVIANWSSLATVFRSFDYGKAKKTAYKQPFPDMSHSFVSNWKHSVLVKSSQEVQDLLAAIAQKLFYIHTKGFQDFELMPYSLSYPLFDFELPRAVNYGGLGSLVSSAISAGMLFWYRNRNSSLIQPFLDCMRRGPFGNVSSGIEAYANAALLLGPVVDAYNKSGEFYDMPVEGFEDYSGLQTLFMSHCYILCGGHSDPDGDAACDISLQYVPEFAEAFKCNQGDPMFPSHQCRLF